MSYTLAKLKTLSLKSNFLAYTKTLMAAQLDSSSSSSNAANSIGYSPDAGSLGIYMDLNDDTKQAHNVYFDTRSSYVDPNNQQLVVSQHTTYPIAKVDSRDVATQTISSKCLFFAIHFAYSLLTCLSH